MTIPKITPALRYSVSQTHLAWGHMQAPWSAATHFHARALSTGNPRQLYTARMRSRTLSVRCGMHDRRRMAPL